LPGPTDDPEKISGELLLSNDGISPQSSRIPSFSTDSWHRLAWIFALVAGAIAFRNLIPYEPFPADRPGPDPWEDWFFRPTGQSAPLIFGLSACFLYTRHRALAAALARPRGGGLGAALLIPATAFYFWATYTGAADLLLISLVGIALGIGAALGGRAGLRATFLPAVFLLLLVPIPAALLNQILYPMQLANAQASAFILNDLLGIPASSVGTVVTSGARTFQVIENCAGLRTISTLWMAAIVYADLFQRSRTETALLLLAAPLIGAVVNLGRVLSLMLNPASEIAAVHTTQGIIMTVVGVLLLAAVDSLLVRRFSADAAYLARWSAPPEPADQDGDDSALATPRNRRALAVASFLAFLLVGGWAIQPWQPTPMLDWVPYRIPVEIDGWRGKPLKTDKHAMGSIHQTTGSTGPTPRAPAGSNSSSPPTTWAAATPACSPPGPCCPARVSRFASRKPCTSKAWRRRWWFPSSGGTSKRWSATAGFLATRVSGEKPSAGSGRSSTATWFPRVSSYWFGSVPRWRARQPPNGEGPRRRFDRFRPRSGRGWTRSSHPSRFEPQFAATSRWGSPPELVCECEPAALGLLLFR